MAHFTSHEDMLNQLVDTQDADSDNRDNGREAHLFIDKRDGQWEPDRWEQCDGAPRYTFDMTGPIVDQIAGDIESSDFSVKVDPAGGDATKDDAALLDGLIRNIVNLSGGTDIFNQAARGMVTAGIDGWIIKQKLVDDDSFDQDLVIEPIASFIDSAWLGPFTKPDASDAEWGVLLEAIPKRKYDEEYPDGKGQSVGDNRKSEVYYNKADSVVVGQIYYIEKVSRELLKLSDGRIVEAEAVESVLDELAQAGITVVDRRKRDKSVVKSRLFDGGDWLGKEQTTVFNQIPIIPVFGNFKVFENKVLYRGVVEKLMDAQRNLNYSKSREIAEGSLAPRAKYWLTEKQMAGHEDTLATLNTNNDPVQPFNSDPESPGQPQQSGGAMINPGLNAISSDMMGLIQNVSGRHAASMGENPGLQSGVAIDALQEKGDQGSIKYYKGLERALARTGRILIDAAPAVYTGERQMRILKDDGTSDIKTLNESVFDQQSLSVVTVNDLSKGKYDVTCSAGTSFKNRQSETVAAFTEIAPFDPSVMQIGGDVLYKNISAPGMDIMAERKRHQLFISGAIPEGQMTDEEKQQLQVMQSQPQEPSPEQKFADAETARVEAETGKVMVDAQVAQRREDREDAKAQNQFQQDQFKQMMDMQQQQMADNKTIIDSIKAEAETLKIMREAMGVDTVVTPVGLNAFQDQVDIIQETQEQL